MTTPEKIIACCALAIPPIEQRLKDPTNGTPEQRAMRQGQVEGYEFIIERLRETGDLGVLEDVKTDVEKHLETAGGMSHWHWSGVELAVMDARSAYTRWGLKE